MDFSKEKLNLLKEINNKLNLEKNNYENIVFIYTPPKVGSTSLVSSIRLFGINKFVVLHIHDELMLNALTGVSGITINEIIQYNKYIGKNIYVIDVYRTPIERKISEYFERLASFHFNNTEENVNNYNIKLIISRFNKLFSHLGNDDYYFEKYDIPKIENFDFEKKYLCQIVNGIKYIKLRLNDSENWGNILTKELGIEIKVIKDYQTINKKIGALYEKFKKEYKLPKNYYNEIQNCKYLKYYNNDKEIEEYLKKWDNKLCEEVKGYTKEEMLIYSEISNENEVLAKIDLNHYTDNGCMCQICNKKREENKEKVKNGKNNIEKIHHQIGIKNEIIIKKTKKRREEERIIRGNMQNIIRK